MWKGRGRRSSWEGLLLFSLPYSLFFPSCRYIYIPLWGPCDKQVYLFSLLCFFPLVKLIFIVFSLFYSNIDTLCTGPPSSVWYHPPYPSTRVGRLFIRYPKYVGTGVYSCVPITSSSTLLSYFTW